MYPVPDAVRAQLGVDHEVLSWADVWTSPWYLAPGTGPAPGYMARLYIETGTVTIDGTTPGTVTSSCQFTAAPTCDPGNQPTALLDALNANGTEVRVSWSIPGTGDDVLLGVFPVTSAVCSDTGEDLTITVTGADRSSVISRRQLPKPYPQPKGIEVSQAIATMIGSVAPGGVTYDFAATPWTVAPYTWPEGQDPWAASVQMATTAGSELYVGNSGRMVMRAIQPPKPGSRAVWAYGEGGAPILGFPNLCTGMSRNRTNAAVYNQIVVVAESTSVGVAAFGSSSSGVAFTCYAADLDSNSPTYALGNYGPATNVIYDELLTNLAEGQQEALLNLNEGLSGGEQVTVTALMQPYHQIWDAVWLQRSRLGIAGLYTVRSITMPLDAAGVMSLLCYRTVQPGTILTSPVAP
ncbi:MAG TPA: hypothetical protein VNF71_14445 [Acidimicrobiales bacterium]|nr:hypothetical protein [Acidimicrobiales bacterium]